MRNGLPLTFSLLVLGAHSLRAGEEISCQSPDGKFALRQIYAETQPYYGSSQIVEAESHRVVTSLVSDVPPSVGAKLLWSKDSQRVAYFNPSSDGPTMRVLFRTDSGFDEIELPELPAPKLPDRASGTTNETKVTKRVEPQRWLPSGDLLFENEWQDPAWGRAAVEVTLGFEQDHRPIVRSAAQQKATVVDYFLLLPAEEFEGPPSTWLRHIREGNGVIDKENGFMHCTGDGAQANFDLALYRYRDGQPLLALCSGELEGEDDVYLSFFEMDAQGKMRKLSRPIFPFRDGGNWRFQLPRVGRTIVVRKSGSEKILHKVTWNGERFQTDVTLKPGR